jgi:hypothetical protein
MIKLNLRENALHTLYHAVEHLHRSQADGLREDGRAFDHDDHSVEWRNEHGDLCFVVPEFTRLPSVYNLKFALLHLIQASELLLKSYVEQCEPTAIFVRLGSRKTIDLRTALAFTIERNPALLTRAEYALLLEAKSFRNAVEHYQFALEERQFRTLCTDFLAICLLLAQALLTVNIADAFSWDYLRDRPDEVASYLSTVLAQISETGRGSAKHSGELWASENPSHPVFRCLNCGARAVSGERGVCMGCGADGDEELVTILEDFAASQRRIVELQRLQNSRSTKSLLT